MTQATEMSDVPSRRTMSVSIARLRPLLEQATAASIDVEDLLSTLDLPADLADQASEDQICLSDYYRIQNRLTALFGDETCHLSERQLLPGSTDFVLRNIGECRSLRDAMQTIADSYNLLHGGQYNSVEMGREFVDYVIDDASFPYNNSFSREDVFFTMESTLIFLHCMLQTVTEGAGDAVRRLYLKRPARDDRSGHLAYWQVPVRFGARKYRLCLDAELATKPLPTINSARLTSAAVYDQILRSIAAPDRALSTYNQVYEALLAGAHEQSDVARALGISVATPRRRLSDEGISFRQLRQEMLNDRAKRLLKDNVSVNQVADLLGFSEFRSFVRAFKSWNGLTPSAFVRQSKS